MTTRVAAKLKKAMRAKAPLRLEKLLKKHPCRDALNGNAGILGAYDGIAMYLELEGERTKAVGDYDQKRYEKAYEKMRDSKAHDNCSPTYWSQRINLFTEKVNPYLEIPLTGARLSKFIIEQLPDALSADERGLKRTISDVQLADATYVNDETLKIIESAYKPGDAAKKALALAQAKGLDGDAGRQAAESEKNHVNRMKQMVAAAVQSAMGNRGAPHGGGKPGAGGRGDKSGAGDKNRATKSARLPEGQYRLPEGQYHQRGAE